MAHPHLTAIFRCNRIADMLGVGENTVRNHRLNMETLRTIDKIKVFERRDGDWIGKYWDEELQEEVRFRKATKEEAEALLAEKEAEAAAIREARRAESPDGFSNGEQLNESETPSEIVAHPHLTAIFRCNRGFAGLS